MTVLEFIEKEIEKNKLPPKRTTELDVDRIYIRGYLDGLNEVKRWIKHDNEQQKLFSCLRRPTIEDLQNSQT